MNENENMCIVHV